MQSEQGHHHRYRHAAGRSSSHKHRAGGRTCFGWWETAEQCTAALWLVAALVHPSTCWSHIYRCLGQMQADIQTDRQLYWQTDKHTMLTMFTAANSGLKADCSSPGDDGMSACCTASPMCHLSGCKVLLVESHNSSKEESTALSVPFYCH